MRMAERGELAEVLAQKVCIAFVRQGQAIVAPSSTPVANDFAVAVVYVRHSAVVRPAHDKGRLIEGRAFNPYLPDGVRAAGAGTRI